MSLLFLEVYDIESSILFNFFKRSLQSVVLPAPDGEEIMINLAKSIRKEYGIKNLCLAGGVALNCVANGKILKEKIFDNIWIQPAAGDAGGSLGAALALWHIENNNKREINPNDDMKDMGPEPQNHGNALCRRFCPGRAGHR